MTATSPRKGRATPSRKEAQLPIPIILSVPMVPKTSRANVNFSGAGWLKRWRQDFWNGNGKGVSS